MSVRVSVILTGDASRRSKITVLLKKLNFNTVMLSAMIVDKQSPGYGQKVIDHMMDSFYRLYKDN
jgi:hypothetical protein